jgi:hypothetical protein
MRRKEAKKTHMHQYLRRFVLALPLWTFMIFLPVYYQLSISNFLYRRFFLGWHVYSFEIVLLLFLAYVVIDGCSLVYLPLFLPIYYACHEGVIDVIFLGVYRYFVPFDKQFEMNYVEFVLTAAFVLVVIAAILEKGSPILRRNWRRVWPLWVCMSAYMAWWIEIGFPTTANIYGVGYPLSTFVNILELIWHSLFALQFFIVFDMSNFFQTVRNQLHEIFSSLRLRRFSHVEGGVAKPELAPT